MIFSYWTGTADLAPEENPSQMEWRQLGFDHRSYSDSDVFPLLRQYGSDLPDLFSRIRIPACKSDLARLVLLYEYGGMYIDAHVGTSDPVLLAKAFAELAAHDLILFDVEWEHNHVGDVHIFNTVMIARKNAEIVKKLINSAVTNLRFQYNREKEKNRYVEYNIYILTGAWDISVNVFDRNSFPIKIKEDLAEKVGIYSLKKGETSFPFQVYKHYNYRRPGLHWSERQKTELLFD